MGGTNPYINYPHLEKPTQTFKVRFLPMDKVVEVNPEKLPYAETGLPGSLLDIALAHDIAIDHACGGVSACSTCHVFVKKGVKSCNEAEDFELDMLESAPGNTVESRLSCQCVPNGREDLVVEVPGWNRNLARETEP